MYLPHETEVWLNKPYNSSVDVYSYGDALYEMIALQRAFDFCTTVDSGTFARHVFEEEQWPALTPLRAPPSIKDILPFSNPEYRCDMATVSRTLRQELVMPRRGDESTLLNFFRRRSTFVYSNRRGRDGSSWSFDESVQSILTPPSPRRRCPGGSYNSIWLAHSSQHDDSNLSLSNRSRGGGKDM